MDHANPTPCRRLRALLAIPALLLALAFLALGAPVPAKAAVRVVAKIDPAAPDAVQVTAHTSVAAKRVVFLVDGRRQYVEGSVDWRHGRRGTIEVEDLESGPHRLTAVATYSRGRQGRGARTIRLAPKPGGRTKAALQSARQVPDSKASTKPKSSPTPGVLFDGGFDDGFDSWHLQALSYRASIFEGGFSQSAAHFEVHQGDVEPETGSQRAEVSGPTFNEGEELYVRDTIRVPSSSDFDSSWQLIQQLREEDWGGSPGTAVFLEDDRQLKIGAGDSSPMFWQGPELEADRWYDLVYRVKLSQDAGTGFVEVWLDGVPQRMVNGETRIYGQTMQRPQNYLKTGIYRSSSSTGTSVVEHDNVMVGTSYEAVASAG